MKPHSNHPHFGSQGTTSISTLQSTIMSARTPERTGRAAPKLLKGHESRVLARAADRGEFGLLFVFAGVNQ
jgi:hypothetical protein